MKFTVSPILSIGDELQLYLLFDSIIKGIQRSLCVTIVADTSNYCQAFSLLQNYHDYKFIYIPFWSSSL